MKWECTILLLQKMDNTDVDFVLKTLTGAIVLSSDEDEKPVEIPPADVPGANTPAEVLVCPREVLVRLHPETLEEMKVLFTFFIDLPKQGLPTRTTSNIHIGSECIDCVSVNINKTKYIAPVIVLPKVDI